jgi:hypothetical protein
MAARKKNCQVMEAKSESCTRDKNGPIVSHATLNAVFLLRTLSSRVLYRKKGSWKQDVMWNTTFAPNTT